MSVSGLSAKHRSEARRIIVAGAALMLRHPWEIHYSQSQARWEGIAHRMLVSRGQFPRHSDCSSSATWLLWNALGHRFGVRDVVNGTRWSAGYTGTMLNHGKRVRDLSGLRIGDCAIYGYGFPGHHVTIYIGGGAWFSHGSEAGPFKLGLHYRPDLMQVRRYI